MKECFTYMFKSENSIRKLGIFYLLIFMAVLIGNCAVMYNPINMFGKISPLFFVFICLDIPFLIFPCGYVILIIQNLINGTNELPDFDYKNIFISGFKFLISFFILLGIILFIFYIFGFLTAFFVKNNLIPFAFIIAVLSFLITMIVSFVIPAGFYNFSKANDLLAFVKLSILTKLIDKNVNNYFKYFILYVFLFCLILVFKVTLFSHLIFMGYLGLIIYTALLSLVFMYFAVVFAGITTHSIQE